MGRLRPRVRHVQTVGRLRAGLGLHRRVRGAVRAGPGGHAGRGGLRVLLPRGHVTVRRDVCVVFAAERDCMARPPADGGWRSVERRPPSSPGRYSVNNVGPVGREDEFPPENRLGYPGVKGRNGGPERVVGRRLIHREAEPSAFGRTCVRRGCSGRTITHVRNIVRDDVARHRHLFGQFVCWYARIRWAGPEGCLGSGDSRAPFNNSAPPGDGRLGGWGGPTPPIYHHWTPRPKKNWAKFSSPAFGRSKIFYGTFGANRFGPKFFVGTFGAFKSSAPTESWVGLGLGSRQRRCPTACVT